MATTDPLRFTKIPLTNGSGVMPALGFGSLIPDPVATKQAIKTALEVGFRHLDCAERYRNEDAVGDAMREAFKAGAVRREDATPHPRIVVDVAAPPGAAVDLFAEGPTPQWALPVPAAAAGAGAGLKRFTFELDGALPDTKYEGALLRLTAVADGEAIEVSFRLD